MEPELYKFSGAGNDFVVVDGRQGGVDALRKADEIRRLCSKYSTDGLMILGAGTGKADFSMEFYNPDGSGGMMCGNGGRCIVAFADMLGIKPSRGDLYEFLAPDGMHTASILDKQPGGNWTVRLKMTDVHGVTPALDGLFTNTGTRHYVQFVADVDTLDVETEGKRLRWNEAFAPEGANVNFVQVQNFSHSEVGEVFFERFCDKNTYSAKEGKVLLVRTFEKGVEGETLACGTGITASALASYFAGKINQTSVNVKARKDWLNVEFEPLSVPGEFRNVYLTGPATLMEI